MAAIVAKSESIFNEHFQELQAFKAFYDKEKDTIDYDNAKLRVKLLESLHEDMKINTMDLIVALKENEDEKVKIRARIAKFTSSFASIHSAFARLVRKRDEHYEEQKAKLAKENLPATGQPRAVKIKPIEPADYDGSVDKWTSYRDVFESIIHNNANLEPIQKFHYLRQSMKLPSGLANVLDTFPFTADNYEAAWDAVKKRYNDKRKIIASHLNSMFTAKKMTNGSSSELRKVIDVYASNLSALKQQGLDIEAKDDLINAVIVHIVTYRLDDETLRDWRKHHKEDTATWSKLQEFLEAQERSLDDRQLAKKVFSKSTDAKPRSSKSYSSSITNNSTEGASSQFQRVCCLCNKQHAIWSCPRFIDMSTSERYKFAQQNSLCLNCLSKGHQHRDCTSQYRCKSCKKDHHSLLHRDDNARNSSVDSFSRAQSSSEVAPKATQSSSYKEEQQKIFSPQPMTKKSNQKSAAIATENSTVNAVSTTMMVSTSHTFLPTILLEVADSTGTFHTCRALLDTGSDANLIQTDLAKKLRLKLDSSTSTLFSVNNQSTKIQFKTEAIIRSRHEHYERKLLFSLLDDVTSYIPARTIDISNFNIPDKYQLADPHFNEATAVDMLLSADIFFDCLLSESVRLPDGPKLTATKFGFIVGGAVNIFNNASTSNHLISSFTVSKRKTLADIDEKLNKFIECEDLPSTTPTRTAEEQYCEQFFLETSRRDESGKFVVFMPKKENKSELGKNFNNALRMFYIQEKRRRNPLINQLYVEYMEDYIATGDMTEVDPKLDIPCHYLPHHGVVKMSSSSTKLRPVFNASSKTETGITLNDLLCVGPTIQPETVDILMRFREKKFAFMADISRMYRQVLIDPSQRDLLRILWRSKPDEPIKHYRLNTVTFGTACAPFLATRVIKQLAIENEKSFPDAAAMMRTSFFVDDLLGGHNSIAKGQRLLLQIKHILQSGGMKLCKFIATHQSLLTQLPKEDLQPIDDNNIIKALGIKFDARRDEFSYQLKPFKLDAPITRAKVLSELFGIFDPIGWIGPVILKAKIFMRKLCLMKLQWDDVLSDEDQLEWTEFRNTITFVNSVVIPRRCVIDQHKIIELHAFCDASILAYGAVVYALSYDGSGRNQVSILIAKSKVSPSNQKTLARLELCAATLLSKLVTRVVNTMSVPINNIILWSDSTIVLSWMAIHPMKLSTFVGNRIAVITELTHGYTWRHIRGTENPADVISRGLKPEEIKDSTLWWNGPSFFNLPQSQWPESCITINENDPEVTTELKRTLLIKSPDHFFQFVDQRISKFTIMVRTFATVNRFIKIRLKIITSKFTDHFSTEELAKAELDIIKIVQRNLFPEEYSFLYRQNQPHLTNEERRTQMFVNKKSSLLLLSPWIDSDGVIRIGGRLSNCRQISNDQKHPILLPYCHFSIALIRHLHHQNIHAGQTALLSFVRERYWPLRAKFTVKKVIRECLTCFRAKPKFSEQFMSDLPAARVTMTTPFMSTAVDYAGYFLVKTGTTRNASSTKCYVAMFKCMSSGCIHLELVSDLTTKAFIAALTRFVARRGKCLEIYSDNGTNFEGTDNALKKIVQNMSSEVAEYCANQGIKWRFTTPRAPHQGGYFESGIKSLKYHLKRIVERSYNFENFTTILCKIESILNSRPITPMTDDPTDLRVLTPGHFLIGRPLNSLPEENLLLFKPNSLQLWEHLQQQSQIFWDRWHKDYLQTLQTRPVKFRQKNEFHIGDMVLLVDKNLPTMKWLMGRITQLFPSRRDNVVRNVEVKTQHGFKQRDVRYLCFLPLQPVPEDHQINFVQE